MMDRIENAIALVQDWVFEHALLPLLYQLGLMHWAEDAFDGLWPAILGCIAVLAAGLLFTPLEHWRPVEAQGGLRSRLPDVIYTLLTRLGILPLVFFFALLPLRLWLKREMADAGYATMTLDQALPWLADHPLITSLVYLMVLDLIEYWRHRLQHRWEWWWALHSLHHSQRQMSFWTDDRNHILDEASRFLLAAIVALLIGVPPAQFILVIMLMGVFESLTHANLKLRFPGPLEWLLVSPRYHRLHHAIGQENSTKHEVRNYAALFPVWDLIFGTADLGRAYPSTGIAAHPRLGAYPESFLGQQWHGCRRLAATTKGKGAPFPRHAREGGHPGARRAVT
jgi:sterol desaturase/sphingolipid hydroxylase (fatty acid hydroxylase superfamily)